MYAITASVWREVEENSIKWADTRHLPTFYLDENVQGIVDEFHAEEIARAIVNPFDDPDITTSITAVNLTKRQP